MSSFICSPKHFSSIEKTVKSLFQSSYRGSDIRSIYLYFCKDIVPELYNHSDGFDQNKAMSKISDMCDKLRELNVLCCTYQYKEHYKDTIDKEISEQMAIVNEEIMGNNLSKVVLFKALNCLFYQIELEHLEEVRPLTKEEKQAYDFFQVFTSKLAENIVSNMPEYDAAAWGID